MRRAKKHSGTDGSLLPTLPWTLAALAFAILPHVQYLPLWITAALLGCAAWRWHIERGRRRLPPAWLRVILALTSFIGVFASFDSISGVGPGSALLAIMAALKLLETRLRRDQFVLLFIAIFLVMSSLLREQYVWSLPYLVAGIALTMSAWLRMSAGGRITPRHTFAIGGRLLLYAAPLALAMWILFPRISTPFWAVPIDTSTATTGLNDSMSPGDISELSASDEVAFRVRFEGRTPLPAERYWRGLVLHRFNGRTWSGWEPGPDPRAHDEIEVAGAPLRYEVMLEPTRQQWVFALDIPYRWTLNDTQLGRQHQLFRSHPIDQRIAYQAVSYPDYRIGATMSGDPRYWNLQLPANANPRTRELSEQMRSRARGEEAYIDQVLRMFREEAFYYTLQPPALGRDPVDAFLFDTRRGFCEHYASAFTVMMRAAGIPSRIVLGYQGGEMNLISNHMVVRQSDAHAWTEVWLPQHGWLRVDPTAAVAPERIEAGMSGARFGEVGASWGLSAPSRWVYELTMVWDSVNARWNEWVLAYGPENQGRFLEWLGMERPDWRKMMLTLVVCVVMMLAGISLLLLWRNRPPRPDAAARLYERFTAKVGIRPATGETPQAYARRIAAAGRAQPREANRVARAFLAARYGRPSPQSIAALKAAVAAFRTTG